MSSADSPPSAARSAARRPVTDPPRILVVASDEALRRTLSEALSSEHDLVFAADEAETLAVLREGGAALLVVDSDRGGGEDAFGLRDAVREAGEAVPMVMMTDQGNEDLAVEALRRGFMDYIVKRPRNLERELLSPRLANTIELSRLTRENEWLQLAIEESQQRLFNIYDSLDDVIMQVDEDCRVASLNRSAAALASCEPKDAVGRLCWELFDFYPCEERRRKSECHIYRTFLEAETLRGEREDARTRSVHQYMTFITTLKDKDYVVYRETDITEKRRLEEKVANALRSLGVDPEDDES